MTKKRRIAIVMGVGIVFILLTAVVVIGCVLHSSINALSFSEWNGAYTVQGFRSGESRRGVFIPSTHEGLPVVAISQNAFTDHKEIRYVRIPDSVTSVGADAFSGCSALSSVILEGSVARVENYAFEGIAAKEIFFHGDSTVSSSIVFHGCDDLTVYYNGKSYDIGVLGCCVGTMK